MENQDYTRELNRFLVEVFNDILKTEEAYPTCPFGRCTSLRRCAGRWTRGGTTGPRPSPPPST